MGLSPDGDGTVQVSTLGVLTSWRVIVTKMRLSINWYFILLASIVHIGNTALSAPFFDVGDVLVRSGNVAAYATPVIVKSKNDVVLLFSDQRMGEPSDHGNVHNTVLVRSFDAGVTWLPCYADLDDFAALTAEWLACSQPHAPGCVMYE